MVGYAGAFFVGLICVVIGISNMRGNISSLHSYHRHKVSEEDRVPFGKKMGLGTIVAGSALLAYSVLTCIGNYTKVAALTVAGSAVLIAGLVVGLGISFYAMIKHNKGIF